MGLLGTKAFLCPLPWVPKGRFKPLLIREGRGCRDKGRAVKKHRVQPWGRVLVPPQGKHIAISWSSSAELIPPPNEDVNYLMKHSSFQRRSQFNTHHLTPDDLWIEGMWALHAPRSLSVTLPLDYKTPYNHSPPSQFLGHTVLRALACCVPLCLAKQ